MPNRVDSRLFGLAKVHTFVYHRNPPEMAGATKRARPWFQDEGGMFTHRPCERWALMYKKTHSICWRPISNALSVKHEQSSFWQARSQQVIKLNIQHSKSLAADANVALWVSPTPARRFEATESPAPGSPHLRPRILQNPCLGDSRLSNSKTRVANDIKQPPKW